MRISFIKVIFILVIAVVLALLINYLQPNGLPLIKTENKAALIDQNYNNPQTDTSVNFYTDKNLKQDQNKIAVEKSKISVDDVILPEYNFSHDSANNQSVGNIVKKDEDLTLSNLTKDVFNQPRLISLNQAYELYKDKILFIDARDTVEFEEGHIAGAINLPYFYVEDFIYRLNTVDKTDPIVTYCEGADCDMAIRLGDELFAKGYKKVFVFFGGWEEWEKTGYPVVTSETDIKLN